MAATLEREIKLRFDDPNTARLAVIAAGGTPMRGRRLQDDSLLDTADGFLRQRGSVLRVRRESGTSLLTFKGPVQPAVMKLREELETAVGDGTLMLRLLAELGFRIWFRYQKYREEFALEDVIIAIDETPVGTYVELEGRRGRDRGRDRGARPRTVRLPARLLPRPVRPPLSSNTACRSPT